VIPARKSPFFVRWFTGQVDKRIRKMFSRVRVRGLDALQETLREAPVIVVSNHTSWWDPMFCILVGHRLLTCDAYAMMDASNLLRLPFLGRVGGFGVHLDDPADRKRVLRYTRDLLGAPGRLVWIFPQGTERPRVAPLDDFKPGAAIIARTTPDVRVVPVGIRYELRGVPGPEAILSIGPPLEAQTDVETARLAQQAAVTRELETIDRFLMTAEGAAEFQTVRKRAPASPGERLAERILAFFTRYRTKGG